MVGRILARPPPKPNILRTRWCFLFAVSSCGSSRYRLKVNPLVWHRLIELTREANCQMGKHGNQRETRGETKIIRFCVCFFQQAINYRFSMSIDKFIRLWKCVGHFIVPRFGPVCCSNRWLLDWMVPFSVYLYIYISFYFEFDLLHRPHVDTITNRPVAVTHATTGYWP